jgi:hypothetical protein
VASDWNAMLSGGERIVIKPTGIQKFDLLNFWRSKKLIFFKIRFVARTAFGLECEVGLFLCGEISIIVLIFNNTNLFFFRTS